MILFLLLGIGVGVVGTIMGVGGGFILIPILLGLYPQLKPEEITAISLFCVCANSVSGSFAHFMRKRIHIPSSLLFSIACIPGAWIGVLLVGQLDRENFESIFATALLILGVYLLSKKERIVDADPSQWKPSFSQYLIGCISSFFIGILSSFLGIGGGIFHVPLLTEFMSFPVHVAVATSQSILAFSSLAASIEHYTRSNFDFSRQFIIYIAIGTIIGAQIGAGVSKKIQGNTIMRLLGIAIIIAGLKLLYIKFI